MKSMGNSSQREKRLAGQVSLALAAGMFSVVPVAHGMPTLDNVETGTNVKVSVGGATAETLSNYAGKSLAGNNNATTASITSESKNNVLNWKDFSVGSTETVGFDNNNYMNIVTGTATSAIDGKLTGGGDIYLINPNGVIFGKTAQVNVGNLYVSTRKDTEVAKSQFTGNTPDVKNVLPALGDSTLTADVVNLIDQGGYVAADQVVMEGRNIRFLNSSTVMNAANTAVNADASKLVLRSNSFDQTNGYIHVGDENGDYKYFAQNVTDAINTAATESTKTTGVVNYALIRTAADLQNIKYNASGHTAGNAKAGYDLSGNYMLADNINASAYTTTWTPIGIGTGGNENEGVVTNSETAAFRGHFDGMYYTVSNFGKVGVNNKPDNSQYLGLFGYTNDARIENVGVQNTNLNGGYAGGIVGFARGTTLLNVWNAGWVNNANQNDIIPAVGKIASNGTYSFSKYIGGIAGYMDSSMMKNAYNESYVLGAGLVGTLAGATEIRDAYNKGKLLAQVDTLHGLYTQAIGSASTVENTYTASVYFHTNTTGQETISGGNKAGVSNSFVLNETVPKKVNGSTPTDATGTNINNKAFYTSNGWSASDISNEGGDDTPWRIYEGYSLPLLTSFMKANGTVSTEYSYDKNGTSIQSVLKASANPVPTNENVYESNLPTKVYDSDRVYKTLTYVEDNNGKYVKKNGEYVWAKPEDASMQHYSKDVYSLPVTYLGMNADGTGITTNTNANAKTFALFYGKQQGFDLYGNNFTITPRSITFDPQNTPVFQKVYDGSPDATDAVLSALSSAGIGSSSGFIGDDSQYLTLTVEGVTAEYEDTLQNGKTIKAKDVGTDKKVTVTVDTGNYDLKLVSKATQYDYLIDNYVVDKSKLLQMNGQTYNTGVITPRGIKVSLRKSTGLDKTYDGSEDVSGTFKIGNDEYTYAAKDETGKKGNIQIVVDKSGMTDAQGEITQAFKDMLIADLGLTSVTSNELDTSKLGDVTAKYVTNDGRTATANVADTAGSTNHVAYMGIKLAAGLAGSANYKFTDANGNDLNYTVANDPTSGYTFLASGTITPLEISAADIQVKTGGKLTKPEYDGQTTWNPTASEVSAYTFGFKDGVLKNNDASKLTLTPTLTNGKAAVTFYYATINGNETTYTPTADATASNLATAANAAGLNVTLGVVQGADAAATAANAKALQNYKWKTGTTGAQATDQLTAGDKVDTVGLAGEINKRALTVTLGDATTVADSQYDGNDVVEGTAYNTFGGSYAKYSGTKQIVADYQNKKPEIKVESVKYQITTGDDGAAKNVAYDSNGNPIAKDVHYTIVLEGEKAANYTLNGANAVNANGTWKATATLNAKGKIKPREVTMTVANAEERLYNGSEFVSPLPAVTLNNLVNGEAQSNVIDTSKIVGRYGSVSANNQFTASADAGDYTGSQAKPNQKILYTGKEIGNTKNYADINTALKTENHGLGRNYKITNTVYGKGVIKKGTITKQQLEDWVNPANKTLTREYNGTGQYNANALKDVSAKSLLPTSDLSLGILTQDAGKLLAKISIAGAIYYNDLTQGKDAGDYNNVQVTFHINGNELTNYDCYNGDFSKSGFGGKITPIKLSASITNAWTPEKTYDSNESFLTGDVVVKANGVTVAGKGIKDLFNISDQSKSKIINNDTVGISVVSAEAVDKNAGNGKAITYKIKSTNNNYTFSNGETNSLKEIPGVGTINARHVAVSSVDDVNKTYDENANVQKNAVVKINMKAAAGNTGIVAGDQGTISIAIDGTTKAGAYEHEYVNRNSATAEAGKWKITYNKGVYDELKKQLGTNYVLDTDATYIRDASHVYGAGKIIPKEYDITGAEIVKPIRKEYDGNASIDASKITKEQLNITDADLWSKLKVTGTYKASGTTGAADAKDGKPIAVKIVLQTPADGHYNYNLTGGMSEKTLNSDSLGEIYARKLYASIDQPAGVSLTKIYDGTDKVKQANVNQWVKLTNADRVVSGDNVKIGTANITATYVGATNEDAKDAADNKTVKFSNIGLLNNEKKNYELILKDKNGAIVATLTGTDKGSLTTSGKISKRAISVTKFGNPADRNYNGDAYVTQDAINALTPTLEMELAELSADEKATLRAEMNGGLEVDKGQLKGVYGYWDPTEASGTFQANPHVKYQDGKAHTAGNEAAKDVLYYDVALKNKGNENILKNYKLADMTAVTINPDSAVGQIVHTAYFKQAMASGKLLPLAITIDAVTEKWETPVTKVYDGNAWIASHGDYKAYDKNGKELPDAVKYLTIIYDPQLDPNLPDADKAQWGTRKVKIAYDEKGKDFKAVYEDANAGTDKVFKVSGLTFTTESLEDFIGDFTLGSNPIKNKYEGKTLTSPDDNKGAIDRRLVTVKADSVDRSRVYNGDAAIVIAAGDHYTGVNAKNNYTGFIGDDAYVTYTANFASTNGEEAADVNIKDASTGTYRTKNVVYTLTLQGGKAANYTFDGSKRTVSADGMGTTATQKGVSAITPREVYVDFKDGVDGTKLNKTYDKSSSLLDGNGKLIVDGLAGKDMSDLVDLTANHGTKQGAAGKTGIIAKDLTAGTKLGYANATANYEDANVAFNNDGKVTTKTVYIQNLNIVNADGSSNGNYVVKAARKAGTDDKALAGSGTIRQRQVDVKSTDTKPVKAYDGTTTVLMPEQRTEYAGDGRKLGKGDPYIQLADGVGDGLAPGNGGTIAADTIADVGITVESALYHDKNAKDGIGVTYTLKWDNMNYELVHWSLEGKGDIKKRTLEVKTAPDLITKDYDGNKDIKDVSQVASKLFVGADDRLGYGFIEEDQEQISKLFTISNSTYASKDTGATNETGVHGTPQRITVNYGLTAAGQQNYQFAANSTGTYTNAQGGRIDRVQVTLKPDDARKKFGSVPQTGYTGTYTGFVNNEDFAQGALTFGRDDSRSTIVGQKYTLLGYVNGEQTSTDTPTFVNGYGNYYFVTEPNTALLIEAQPSTQDPVIADKQFVPDDYAYNRISKDADVTRFGHAAKASLQYAESGVNLDERTRSGLESSMDIEGSGSVVNLAGARMWFLDKEETPEQVAAEAALPMTEEASSEDVSSIDLEREGGETRRSSSLLEILTKASENGEDKKPSIVVNTMDEEDEDEEKESRGVVVVDRTNIAIETQGNTVNLDRMIG